MRSRGALVVPSDESRFYGVLCARAARANVSALTLRQIIRYRVIQLTACGPFSNVEPMSARSILRRRLGGATVTAWFAVMVVIGAGLLTKHVVAMPRPQAALLTPALQMLRSPNEQNQWLAVHVLYSDCRCSQRVAEHLATTDRPQGWSEIVLWVGDDAPPTGLPDHFDLRHTSAAQLASYGVEAAPSMILADPNGSIRYSGGYTDRKQGPVIDDLRILRAVHRSENVPSLPLFGCAVSSRLKADLAVLPTF